MYNKNKPMMIVKNSGKHTEKPKNYKRKGIICSCLCPIITYNNDNPSIKILDFTTVKYSLDPNKLMKNIKKPNIGKKSTNWLAYQFWATFKEVLEIPKIFDQLSENDFIIRTAYFTRDCVQVPFILEIEVIDIKKYQSLKLKENRKNKLNKFLNI